MWGDFFESFTLGRAVSNTLDTILFHLTGTLTLSCSLSTVVTAPLKGLMTTSPTFCCFSPSHVTLTGTVQHEFDHGCHMQLLIPR